MGSIRINFLKRMKAQKNSLQSRNITWRGHHGDVSQSITGYVESRLDSLEKLLNAGTEEVMYSIGVGKETGHHKNGDTLYKAEVQIMHNGKTFYAEASSDDPHAAIDEVRDELASQIRKHKGKTFAKFKRGGERLKGLIKGIFRRTRE